MNYFEPNLTPDELRAISAIGLAHMGDAVYETLVRTWLCVHGKATGVYKRGRNANVHAMPRSATPAQYHAATGLECLMGWLYLRGDKERAEQLFRAMMEEE